ncbi:MULTISPECIES: hypothetical protein [Dietzia]|nr:hypothetical protein [Dietzia sp. Die43]
MFDSSSDLGSALGDMTTDFLGATVEMIVGFVTRSGELFLGSAS